MLDPSDPLFWLIAAGLTLPWGLVVWLGMEVDKWRDRAERARAAFNDAQRQLAALPPLPLTEPDGSRVIPFEPRVIEGGKSGGKYQRPPTAAAVVDIPFKGPIS